MLEAEHIKQMCFEVQKFYQRSNFRLDTIPVIVFEFTDIGEYANARQVLMQAMDAELAYSGGHRRKSSSTEEIDCYGVTVRLICKKKVVTPVGVRWAADMR